MTDHNTHGTCFLDLPAELRNEIYIEALVWEDDIIGTVPNSGIPEPPLLFVSRQVRSESLPVYYGSNVFVVCSYEVNELLSNLSASKVAQIRALRVLLRSSTAPFHRLERMPRIRTQGNNPWANVQ